MKKITVIKPISMKKQYEIRRWVIISGILSSVVVSTLLAITVFQLYNIATLKHDKKLILQKYKQYYAPIIKGFKKYKEEEQKLTKKKKSIDHYIGSSHTMINLLKAVINACKDSVHVITYTYDNANITLTARCKTTDHINDFVASLYKSKLFTNLSVITLQKEKHDSMPPFLFTIKGFIVQKARSPK